MDPCLGRRIASGVVQQLGQGVDQRLDAASEDADLGHGVQIDALVVGDPGHGTAEHVEQRDGLLPLTTRPGPAEYGDAVREPADQCGPVVDAQQVAEDVRVLTVFVLQLP